MDALWYSLRETIRRHNEFDAILHAIPVHASDGTVEPFAAMRATALIDLRHKVEMKEWLVSTPAEPASVGSVDSCEDCDDALPPADWAEGLSIDVLCIVLRHTGMAGSGAAACSCRGWRDVAMLDDVWSAHAEALDVDVASATAARPCRAMCRDLCRRRRLDAWMHAVEDMWRHVGCASTQIADRLADAMRRLSRLQFEDYREVRRGVAAPPAALLLSLSHTQERVHAHSRVLRI